MTGLQAVYVFFSGESFCFNEGCKVAGALIKIPDIYLHIAGFLYFQLVCWLAFYSVPSKKRGFLSSEVRDKNTLSFLSLFLLSGFVLEGVLINYQFFVSQSWCAYCVAVFVTILFLNFIYGGAHLFTGLMLFIIQVIAFSVLNFQGATIAADTATIEKGTIAVRGCDKPSKRLYLVFSESCPHCISVLESLRTCTACEIHFNPIARINSELLPGLSLIQQYDPEVNQRLLKLLGINSIPVLIAEEPGGLEFIKGQNNITSYLNQHCTVAGQTGLDSFYENPFASSKDAACSMSNSGCEESVLNSNFKQGGFKN